MSGAMKYERYKPTGIPWPPEVPEGWEVARLKNVLRERVEKSISGLEEPLSMSQKRGIVPTSEMDVVPNAAASYIGAKKVSVDDIVFNKLKAHLGVFAISAYEGLVSPDYAVYTGRGVIDLKFLEYLFHTPKYIAEFRRNSTGIAIGLTRLYTKDLFKIYAVCPPADTQRAIVAYLDDKCAKIDSVIASKEREAELLKEYKQSLIARAVTRGLDKNAPLKPTGIPWLPEVPEGWEVVPLRYCFESSFSGAWGSEKGDAEVDLVCYRVADFDYEHSGLCDKKLTVRSYKENDVSGKRVKYGDLLIEKSGGGDVSPVGRVVFVDKDYDATCSNFIQQLRCKDNFVSKFLCHVFRYLYSRKINGYFYNQTIGIQNLKVARYLSLSFPLPPLPTQRAIVAYIEEKSAKIDAKVAALEREVELLREYKQSLIADVVTGRRRVT